MEDHSIEKKVDNIIKSAEEIEKDLSDEQKHPLLKHTRASETAKILILFYAYGTITYELAKELAKGIEKGGAQVDIRRVPETQSDERLAKWGTSRKEIEELLKDVPIVNHEELANYDGFFFGSPSINCSIAPQMQRFLGSLGDYWMNFKLQGKFAGVFSSGAFVQGGSDTTMLSMMFALISFGLVFVGFPPSFKTNTNEEVHGVSHFGVATISGVTKKHKPSDIESEAARHHGEHLAKLCQKMIANPGKIKSLEP